MTPEVRQLLLSLIDCPTWQEACRLTERLEELGYDAGIELGPPLSTGERVRVRLPRGTVAELGLHPAQGEKLTAPDQLFVTEEDQHPARTLPLNPSAVHTRSPAAPEPRQAARPLRFEEYPREVREAFLAQANAPPVAPEPAVRHREGYVWIEGVDDKPGEWLPTAAFRV